MDINFNKNEDHHKLLASELKKRLSKAKLGGGQKKIEKHHKKGKMTARERIDYLLDANSKSIEIGALAGEGMYLKYGGCPSGGVIVKIGYIQKNNVLLSQMMLRLKLVLGFQLLERKIFVLKKLL